MKKIEWVRFFLGRFEILKKSIPFLFLIVVEKNHLIKVIELCNTFKMSY